MVKVYGPMMSMNASGKLADAVVFSSWKGRNYVRQLVTPSNPKSAGQTGVRAMFKFLAQNWAGLSSSHQATWDARAAETSISPFNAFMGYNQARWRNFTGPSWDYPAAAELQQCTFAAASATAGVRQITIAKEVTAQNNGWALGIHRDLETAFTPTFANCIAVIFAQAPAVYSYVDTPLVPDQYFYNFSAFTLDGLRELEDDECDDTVV